jgi:hypothetical protein
VRETGIQEEEDEEIVATAQNRSTSINRKARGSHHLLHQELPPFVPISLLDFIHEFTASGATGRVVSPLTKILEGHI